MSVTVDEESVEVHQALKPLLESVRDHPELLASGDDATRESALLATKSIFDQAVSLEPVASRHINALLKSLENYSTEPRTRSQSKAAQTNDSSKPPAPSLPKFTSTPLDSLYLDGMNADQVWEQLELRTKTIVDVLGVFVQSDDPEEEDGASEGSSDYDEDMKAVVSGDRPEGEDEDEDMDLDMDDIDNYHDVDSEDDDDIAEGEQGFGGYGFDDLEEEDEDEDDGDEEDYEEETIAPLRPAHEEVPELDLDRARGGRSLSASRRPGHPTLDDGFFSIDEFNRETEELESQSRTSGRLSGDEDEDEDDEDVDLFAPVDEASTQAFAEEDEDDDPSSYNPSYQDFFLPPSRLTSSSSSSNSKSSSKPKSKKRPHQDDEPPTPSPKKKSKASSPSHNDKTANVNGEKKIKRGVTFNDNVRVKTIASRKNTPAERRALMMRLSGGAGVVDDDDDDGSDEDEDGDEEDVDWDMENFDDAEGVEWGEEDEEEEEEEEEGEEDSEATESDPDGEDEGEDEDVGVETIQRLKNDLFDDEEGESESKGPTLSAHAKRLAALSSEIASFEAENVGKKDWTLMGEANSRSRPKNSLLEEDLEFERSGGARAAPAVTEEKTTTLEGMIKKRIMDAHFDDVVRRRPISDESPFLPSKLFELDGNKSSKSLAQIYEDDFTAARDGEGTVIDDRDGKLAKEHEALDKMWNEICYKLDALSNAHFTPKQPTAQISTISNISTTSLESALPTTSSTSTLLAPEELLAPSSNNKSKSELTPSEKRSLHNKQKKLRRKKSDAVKTLMESRAKHGKRSGRSESARKEKDEALRSLVKSGKGVTVVGKDSTSGNARRAAAANGKDVGRGKSAKEGVPSASGASFKL